MAAAPTAAPAAADEDAVAPSPPGDGGWRRLAAHVALLVLALGLSLGVAPLRQAWNADEGAYVQATRLVRDEGRWSEVRPELHLDETPSRYPLARSEVAADGRAFPYAKHPAWVLVLVASTTLVGEPLGFLLPNAAGVVAAAVVAWAVARRLGARRPAVAFWVAGLAPSFVLASAPWAHPVAAALGGAVALGVVGLTGRRSWPAAVGTGLALGGLVLLRSEAVFLVVAAPAVVLGARWLWSGDRRPSSVVDPAVAGALGVAAFLVERRWKASLLGADAGTSGPASSGEGWLSGRLSGLSRSVLAGSPADAVAALLVAVALVLVVASVVAAARKAPPAVVGGLGAVAALLVAVRVALAPGDLVTGLLPAWPVVVAGVGAWVVARRSAATPERALAAMAALVAGAVILTQYPVGGGPEWGGRFFAPLTVPLAVLAVLGLERVAGTAGPARDRAVAAVAVGVTAVLALAGTLTTLDMRENLAPVLDGVHASGAEVAISVNDFAPRFDLRPDGTVAWERSTAEALPAALDQAFARGATRVAVVGAPDDDVSAPGATCEVVREGLVTCDGAARRPAG